MVRLRGLQPLFAGALFALCLLWAVTELRTALDRPHDPMAELEAEFEAFIPDIPARGEIGYLEPYVDGGSEAAVRLHYAAQYALTPRIIVAHVGPEFLIVTRGSAKPGGDPRLDGYLRILTLPNGHSLYRRFP